MYIPRYHPNWQSPLLNARDVYPIHSFFNGERYGLAYLNKIQPTTPGELQSQFLTELSLSPSL